MAYKLKWLLLLIGMLAVLMMPKAASAQVPGVPDLNNLSATCEGEFLNPLTDVCWECMLPITIGKIEVAPSSKHDYGNPTNPFCLCGIKPGIAIGYWEPRRLLDMTRKPWCFPNLGGMNLDPGIGFEAGSRANKQLNKNLDTWHSHYYIYPVLSILNLVTDVLCADVVQFDIGYVTELDPVWNSDALSLILNPEAIIFSNPVAVMACTVDCALSSGGKSSKELFWCQGCENSVYPMNGNVSGEEVQARGALTVAQRMAFKLHRQFIMFTSAGEENLCTKSVQPLMDKRQYRFQLTQPKAITSGPFTCPNIGFPTTPYDTGITVPIKGEDFGALLFAKRNCCAL